MSFFIRSSQKRALRIMQTSLSVDLPFNVKNGTKWYAIEYYINIDYLVPCYWNIIKYFINTCNFTIPIMPLWMSNKRLSQSNQSMLLYPACIKLILFSDVECHSQGSSSGAEPGEWSSHVEWTQRSREEISWNDPSTSRPGNFLCSWLSHNWA